MKTLQENNQNLLAITGDFKTLSHQILQGKGTIGALMADNTMALQLRAAMKNLQTATQNAAVMAASLNAFSNKLNTKGGLADKMLTDTATFNHIRLAVNQLQQAANNASTLTNNLNKASDKLNRTDNALGVLLNDPKAPLKYKPPSITCNKAPSNSTTTWKPPSTTFFCAIPSHGEGCGRLERKSREGLSHAAKFTIASTASLRAKRGNHWQTGPLARRLSPPVPAGSLDRVPCGSAP
jgi:hypothetical protein